MSTIAGQPRERDERAAVLAMLRRHGYNTTGFQALEPSLRYWFAGADACVAYADTGSSWVAAGAPIAEGHRLGEVARAFVEEARAHGRRACFFGAERRFVAASDMPATQVASQPVWDPTEWTTAPRRRSVREQLRRARAKGVSVQRLSEGELGDPRIRRAIEDLRDAWLATRRMPAMGFLVDVELFAFAEERALFVARRADELVGLLGAVPIYLREGWLFEDLFRLPDAPNGTTELLVDAAMRDLASRGCRFATLGMVPLSGVGGWLRRARALTRALYDFGGLEAFRAKLDPLRADPIFLVRPEGTSFLRALLDVLRAFAGRSLVGFGVATISRAFGGRSRTARARLALPTDGSSPSA